MYKIKPQIIKAREDTKTVIANFERLVEAASLIVVALFSYLVITSKVDGQHLSTAGKYTVIAACVVIGLRGSVEFLRFLRDKE